MTTPDETEILVGHADRGDPRALGVLLERHKDRLIKVVSFRLDSRLKSRIDPVDVVQEAFVEATIRIQRDRRDDRLPFFLWLRLLTLQELYEVHQVHLGVQARDAGRDVSIFSGPLPQATSAVIAAQLMGRHTSPSEAAIRIETKLKVEEALNDMNEVDREILALRHFERLSNQETARVLGITVTAASNRFVRALQRLKSVLREDPKQLGS